MPEPVKSDAAAILQQIIDDRGLKNTYLAQQIGLSDSSMSSLLHGRKKFTGDIALKISKVLNIPVSVFLTKSYS